VGNFRRYREQVKGEEALIRKREKKIRGNADWSGKCDEKEEIQKPPEKL